jgi:uncharacterized protein (TIGR02391 family)
MVPRGIRGTMMKQRRVADDGTVTEGDIEAMDLGLKDGLTFRIDADVEEGDQISYTLASGKERVMRIYDIEVRQDPRGGTNPLDHIGAKYTVVTSKAALRQPSPVTLPGQHPLISAASGSKVASGHYDNAVFDAFKAVEDRVQALTGSTLSGKPLMANVFNEQNPLLDITTDTANDAQKADQREGYKFLFMGASQGLRNPRAHGADLKTEEAEAMEVLATASHLMRALDRAEKRLPKPQHKRPIQKLPKGIGGATGRI